MEEGRRLSVRSALVALPVGVILGGLAGGVIGGVIYTPDPACDYFCFTRGSYVVWGAMLGALFGPFASLMIWALWGLWTTRRSGGTA